MPVQASTTYYVTLVLSLMEDEAGAAGKGIDSARGDFFAKKTASD